MVHLHYSIGLVLCSLVLAVPTPSFDASSDHTKYVEIPFSKTLRTRTNTSGLSVKQYDDIPNGVIPTDLARRTMGYSINATVGSPPQPVELLLDTGSSDVFVFLTSCSDCASSYFEPSKSQTFESRPDFGPFSIAYADGSGVKGDYGSDQLGVGTATATQFIGLAREKTGDGFLDGIFGVGLDENESIVDENGKDHYPGFITTLKSNGLINSRAYSIYLNTRSDTDRATGKITFGGFPQGAWTGDLVYFPMVEKAPNGQYPIDILEPVLSYDQGDGATEKIEVVDKKYTVLLDTGSVYCLIPEKQFQVIADAVDAQKLKDNSSYTVDCSQANKPGGVNFFFDGPDGNVTIKVPWVEMVMTHDQSLPDGRCLFGLLPSSNDEADGVYTLGDTFIRSTFLTFDYDSLRVGVAQVKYDHE